MLDGLSDFLGGLSTNEAQEALTAQKSQDLGQMDFDSFLSLESLPGANTASDAHTDHTVISACEHHPTPHTTNKSTNIKQKNKRKKRK